MYSASVMRVVPDATDQAAAAIFDAATSFHPAVDVLIQATATQAIALLSDARAAADMLIAAHACHCDCCKRARMCASLAPFCKLCLHTAGSACHAAGNITTGAIADHAIATAESPVISWNATASADPDTAAVCNPGIPQLPDGR